MLTGDFYQFSSTHYNISFLLNLCNMYKCATGLLVNGPYALITTSVSAELGTHKSLVSSAKALATVTAIIDGTGSIGKYRSSIIHKSFILL